MKLINYDEYVEKYQSIDKKNNNNDKLVACIEENARRLREKGEKQ